MCIIAFAELPVQKAARAEDSNVALVQRRQWPPEELRFGGVCDALRLQPRGRLFEQILNQVERQSSVVDLRGQARRHFVDAIRVVR